MKWKSLKINKMKPTQTLARILYRSCTITMLIMLYSPQAYWSLPFGIIVGLLSEAESITKN
jgi:hypothetical protein